MFLHDVYKTIKGLNVSYTFFLFSKPAKSINTSSSLLFQQLSQTTSTMKSYQIVAVALLAGASNVAAWGFEGHETVAYVATNFVASSTKTFFQDILGDTSDDYLASVAAWADEWKYTSAGEFSKEFHYIDALDNPPTACDVKYARDCAEDNCVVSAIVNYTSQLTDSSTSSSEKDIAAKVCNSSINPNFKLTID